MTAEHFNILRGRFSEREFALLTEVEFGNRRIDALAMNLWHSRGMQIHGIEVKSHRSDWLKEIKTPEKQEEVFKYCDRFWLFATNEKVAKESEIPKDWGFMVIKNEKVFLIKEAPKLTPVPLTRPVMASMLQRAQNDLVHPHSLSDLIDKEVDKYLTSWKKENEKLQNKLNTLTNSLKRFEEAVGISVETLCSDKYELPENMGYFIRSIIRDGSISTYVEKLTYMKQDMESLINKFQQKL